MADKYTPEEKKLFQLLAVWRKHKKHIFLFSNAGKPIFTRYSCDENKLAGVTGILVAIVSFIKSFNDSILSVKAGKHKIVFLMREPIFCAMVAETTESATQMSLQLELMHSQIISILTQTAHKILADKPNFDLRNLLGGTDKYLENLASRMNREAPFLLNSIHCLRIPSSLRNTIGSIVQNAREGDLFYALMIAKGQLVHLVRPKKHILYPPDLHLVINFINSSKAFKSSDACLTPICLPKFNSGGFLHLYVCYLTSDVCLLLLSSKAEDFPQMTISKDRILTGLQGTLLEQLEQSIKASHYTIEDVGIPELIHFLYKAQQLSQMTSPSPGPPYNTRKQQKKLFRIYQHIHQTVHLNPDQPHKVYYHRSESETIVAWVTNGFDLYACFGPLVSKANAVTACNKLLRWIKQEENNLFILTAPVW